MQATPIIKGKVSAQVCPGVLGILRIPDVNLLVCDSVPQTLDEDVVECPAGSSLLMVTPASSSHLVKSWLVNWLPWSKVKISSCPLVSAVSRICRQKPPFIVGGRWR
jgi:hypothetical protein